MIFENVELTSLNTFGIRARAERFASFSSVDELRDILAHRNGAPLFILGGGSNILLTQDIQGLVIHNQIPGIEEIQRDANHVHLKVGAGVVWHEFVMHCVENDLGGVENLSLIPGSVGASPMQNIGAYGVEIKDVFVELEAYNIESGEVRKFDAEACEFGYRESVFKRRLKGQYIIVSVTFRLSLNPTINSSYGAIESELNAAGVIDPGIKDISKAVIAIRSSKLPNPAEIGNAGSFFKNPVVETSVLKNIQHRHDNVPNYPASGGNVKLAAGWLIDQAGWKGKRFGNYGVHDRQALVLVNHGNCSGRDIFDLSERIISDIQEKFGITLEREVNII